MPHADFVHLRVHTAYSLSEGAVKIKELVKLCQENRMPAVAITDSGNLFGAMEFSGTMPAAGVQPIIGSIVRITRESGADRFGRKPEPEPMVFLAQNEGGYNNLVKLVSWAFLRTPTGETPQVPIEALEKHGEGLIALTGGPDGPVGSLLQDDKQGEAEALARRLSDIFPGRLYIELMRHDLEAERLTRAGVPETCLRPRPAAGCNQRRLFHHPGHVRGA